MNQDHDFLNPDYSRIFKRRAGNLAKIRAQPECISQLNKFYRDNITRFINDWGMVHEPRNISKGRPAMIPFLLYPKQEEWAHWFLERWLKNENGLSDKSRAVGLTWLAVAITVSLALFNDDMVIGFCSKKEELVDKRGSPDSIFHKIRTFLMCLPIEFRGGYEEKTCSTHRRILLPHTKSVLLGGSGDNAFRGGRLSIGIQDESAHYGNSASVDAAMSEATPCLIAISTPHGRNNSFARKRFSGEISVLSFSWRDDPSKTEEWYEHRKKQICDPVIIEQELNLGYSGSVDGVIIPEQWVIAAIDAHIKLGIEKEGVQLLALDIADRGRDLNAVCFRHGIVIDFVEEWSGANSDTYQTLYRASQLYDAFLAEHIRYDGDGIGAPMRGDGRIINERREERGQELIDFKVFRGSGKIVYPDEDIYYRPGMPRDVGAGIKNKDHFVNFKAQSWFSLKCRFQRTYLALEAMKNDEDIYYDPSELISISSKLLDSKGSNLREKLIAELSQPVFQESGNGKIMVEKTPEDAASPNLADAVMMAFAPYKFTRGILSA